MPASNGPSRAVVGVGVVVVVVAVVAVVVLRAAAKGQTTESGLIDWCKAHMAAYNCLRVVELIAMLPKSGSGKVMWRLLQEAESAKAPKRHNQNL